MRGSVFSFAALLSLVALAHAGDDVGADRAVTTAPPLTPQIPLDSVEQYPVGRVMVQPVLFVPKGQQAALRQWTGGSSPKIDDYLKVVRNKWEQMLGGPAFDYTPRKTVYGNEPFDGTKKKSDFFVATQGQVLSALGVAPEMPATPDICDFDRIVLILVVGVKSSQLGTASNWCSYATFNGPGVALISIDYEYAEGQLTSTLVHELGHTFGLRHSWERPEAGSKSKTSKLPRYDESLSNSVMSYNPTHHTNSTLLANVKGTLLDVDRFELAFNKRVLPRFHFTDELSAGEQEYVPFLRHPIKPISSSYDMYTMWQSPSTNPKGWVSLPVVLPRVETVTRIVIETGVAGGQKVAKAAQVEAMTASTAFKKVGQLQDADGRIDLSVSAVSAQEWKIALRTSPGQQVVLRGVRFFNGNTELYPPKD